MNHFRRYGFFYALIVFFLGSWLGQFVATANAPGPFPWNEFWAATFENWQSEFLQLAVQALGMVILARWVFAKAKEDTERIEEKIDVLLERS